jgi:4-hydroxybenzoate polyprenyltransferase
MLIGHMVGIAYCFVVGGMRQKLLGIVLGWVYNELGAADRSCIGKNAVNALGYVTFSMGAISVATDGRFTACGFQWFVMIGCVVFTTVQMQDLADMEGDGIRARRTVPLVIGSRPCRWSIAFRANLTNCTL